MRARAPGRTVGEASDEPQAHEHRGGQRLDLVEAQVPVEGDGIGVVRGHIQVDPGDAPVAQVGEQRLDERPAQTLTPGSLQQVDMEMRRELAPPPTSGARSGAWMRRTSSASGVVLVRSGYRTRSGRPPLGLGPAPRRHGVSSAASR